ncbi:hypothetical protein F5Y17DRAFT_30304 [Xylariaceae sp. FL0594]|nr:hypothetical protein F5Y17DRAFT_30304 [Xylariaceae sp. FL0594]
MRLESRARIAIRDCISQPAIFTLALWLLPLNEASDCSRPFGSRLSPVFFFPWSFRHLDCRLFLVGPDEPCLQKFLARRPTLPISSTTYT